MMVDRRIMMEVVERATETFKETAGEEEITTVVEIIMATIRGQLSPPQTTPHSLTIKGDHSLNLT